MIKCPKCGEKGINELRLRSAKGGELIVCELCAGEFTYKKVSQLRYLPLYLFGLLLPLIQGLLIMMLSFGFNLNEFWLCASFIIPVFLLMLGRNAIKQDKRNLLQTTGVK